MKKTTPAVVCVDSDQVMELEVGLGWVWARTDLTGWPGFVGLVDYKGDFLVKRRA